MSFNYIRFGAICYIFKMKRKASLAILAVSAATGLFFYFGNPALTENSECLVKIQKKTVRGISLSGLIEDNDTVKILFGFYNCNEIQREDIVAYKFSGNPELVIKIVKGLPGDRFDLKKSGSAWQILINNEIVKNFSGNPYQLSDGSYNLLNLYVKDYQGIIPPNAYLILGNLAQGSLDSSRFGLVDKRGVAGKVLVL